MNLIKLVTNSPVFYILSTTLCECKYLYSLIHFPVCWSCCYMLSTLEYWPHLSVILPVDNSLKSSVFVPWAPFLSLNKHNTCHTYHHAFKAYVLRKIIQFIFLRDNGVNLVVLNGARLRCVLSLYSWRQRDCLRASSPARSIFILTLHCEHANDANARSSHRRPVETPSPRTEHRDPAKRTESRRQSYVPAQRWLLRDLML